MSDRAYDHDALAWAEHQAGLLRRLAAGERLNEPVDWPNVIKEIQDLGLSELRACRSFLYQAIVHLLKLHAWPASRAAGHWTSELIGFMGELEDALAPSMHVRLDMAKLYARALRQVGAASDESGAPRHLPLTCPYRLNDLITSEPDLAGLVAMLEVKPA